MTSHPSPEDGRPQSDCETKSPGTSPTRPVVAFFCDRHMVPGLHAALATLLFHWQQSAPLDVYVFADRLGRRDQALVAATAGRYSGPAVSLKVVPYAPEAPPGSRRLYGSATLFGRLDLPLLLPHSDFCLYLDCDLIVEMDVASIISRFGDDAPLYADGTGVRSLAFEKDLYKQAGLDPAGPCFNSGVLGLNLRQWRARDLRARCLEVCTRFGGNSRLTDQGMLNIAFAETFQPLGASVNTPLYPSTSRLSGSGGERILHFVGSPKPWDLMGGLIHRNHDLWRRWVQKTAWWNIRSRLAPLLFARRNLLVARSTIRAICIRH